MALREFKPPFAQPTDRVFETVPTLRTFKRDLERAGIPFQDDRGRTVDRHALRTTFISWLGLCGVDPRAQIILARHAPQGVTLRHYQDFSILDLWSEIRKLPPIRTKAAEAEESQATGTDDRHAPTAMGVVLPVVQQPGRKGVKLAATGRIDDEPHHAPDAGKPLKKRALRGKNDWAMQDLNLRPPPCKGGALAD